MGNENVVKIHMSALHAQVSLFISFGLSWDRISNFSMELMRAPLVVHAVLSK